jgi:hypothetical protein
MPIEHAWFPATVTPWISPIMSVDPFTTSADRRRFLIEAGNGFGALALAAMLAEQQQVVGAPMATSPLMPRPPHVQPRATRVIYLFMHGGPSQVDLFDPKPELIRHAGQPLPDQFGKVMTRRKVATNPLLGPVSDQSTAWSGQTIPPAW